MAIMNHNGKRPRLAITPPTTAAVSPGITKPTKMASSANTRAKTMHPIRSGLVFKSPSKRACMVNSLAVEAVLRQEKGKGAVARASRAEASVALQTSEPIRRCRPLGRRERSLETCPGGRHVDVHADSHKLIRT